MDNGQQLNRLTSSSYFGTREELGNTPERHVTGDTPNVYPKEVHNIRAMGNRAAEAVGSGQPQDTVTGDLGQVTEIVAPPSATTNDDLARVELTWSDAEHTKLTAKSMQVVLDLQRKLSADGDVDSFYRQFRGMAEIAQEKER